MPTYTLNNVNYTYTVGTVAASVGVSASASGSITLLSSFVVGGATYNVTSIAASAFLNKTGLTSVVIPDSVTIIGANAFQGCTALVDVTMSTSVTSIGASAFSGCTNLLPIILPNTLATIGASAFANCSKFSTVTIPTSMTTIGASAFSGCTGLTTVTIPNTVTSIGASAFSGCIRLTTLTIPNVTYIGVSAFEGSALKSVNLPSVITIAEKAFHNCWNLESVTLSTVFTTWNGPAGFQECPKLANVVIKSLPGCGILQQMNYSDNLSVTFDYTGAIPESITENVRNLTNVTFGPNITSIGLYSFESCAKLTTVTIPDKVISIGNTAFQNCSVLNTVTFNTTTAFRTIGSNAFNGCLSLVSINIPSSTTSINNAAFYECSKLSTCTISQNMNISTIGDDVFYNCSSLSSIVIPSSVRSIGSYSFYNCKSLTTVNIPTLATSIGNGAFFGSGLTSIVIPNVSAISSYAFYSCTNLTSVTIPNTVWLIDTSAFVNCSSLTSITIPASVTTIRDGAFYETGANLTNITVAGTNPDFSSENGVLFNKAKTTMWLYPSASLNTSYVIPSTVTSISAYAFVGCSNLTSITIPNSVVNIPDFTFYRLTNTLSNIVINANNTRFLTENGVLFNAAKTTLLLYPPGLLNNSYVIPSTVTSINSSAFSGCTNLTSVTIPSSVTTIKDSTFFGCTNLTSVSIPTTVTSIATNAFSYCSSLTSITLPASLTTIGVSAFSYCSGLTSVTIPASVTTIGAEAFRNCTNVSSITVAATNTSYLSENGILFNKAKTTLILYPPASLNTSYVIPNTVSTITAYAFNQCANLTTVSIPGLVTINNFTFTLCNLLSTVIFLDNVPVIYSNNFGATGDTAVYINSTANNNSSFILSMFTNVISQNIPTLTNFVIPRITYSNSPYKIPPPTSDMSGVFTYVSTYTPTATISGDMLTTVNLVGGTYIYATQTVTRTYGLGTLTTSATIAAGTSFAQGSPTLSFSIPAKRVGDAAFTLVPPTSDSSGTFTYTSSNTAVATVTNAGLITVKVAGVTNITANQGATTNWVAKSIVAVFAVDASTSTITPTITNFSIPPKALGSAAFSLVPPTSDSSGAFTYTSSNTAVATVSGTTVTVVAVGSSTITAVQAGNATYKSGSIASEFVVSLTQPTILSSFSVPAKTFGDASFSIIAPTTNGNGTFTYTSSDISVATIVGDVVTIVGGGTTTITATQSSTPAFTSATITAPLTVSKVTSTITDFSVVSKAVGDASFSLVNPTSNSVGAFTYTSSDTSVATIAGNVVTIVGVGSSTITAVQASSTNYLSGSTTAVFQVTQGVLTLTNFSVPAKSVGNADFVLVPPTTGSTGLITYTSSDTSVATIVENVVTIVGVGTSTITASQESTANYTSATITASFTVGLAATITDFSVSAKTFGDASFSLVNPTSDSDGLFTYISSDISVATIDGSIVTIVGGGTTTITAVQALTATYGPGSISATLVVNKATTILTDFSVVTKTFGDASFNIIAPTTNGNGAFTYTSSDTSVATVTGSRITIVGGGSATITAVQAATVNYLTETITAPFTVNQKAPTITNFVVPAKITADAPFSLIAPTSNSSGAFTYTSSDTSVATIEGSTVTIVGNGSSIITATQESTANYLSGSITSTLIVRLTPILTDFSVATKIIGDVSFALIPPTTNSDGIFTYISSDISIATIVGNRVNIVKAGTVTITANQSLTANYGAGTITASFVVNKITTIIVPFTIAPKPLGTSRFNIGGVVAANRPWVQSAVMLTSSNPSVAIIEHQVNQQTWNITPIAIGNTTIIATASSTDIYAEATISTNFNVFETIPYTYDNVNYLCNVGYGTANVTGGITPTPTSLTVLESFVVNGITYTVTHIRDSAFANYTNLIGISLPSSILTIGYNCFANSGLTAFTFPPLVTTIEESTFIGSALTSITIPSTITTIRYNYDGRHGGSSTGPFVGCGRLVNIVVNTYISGFQYVFYRLNNVNTSVTFDYQGSVPPICLENMTNLKTVIIGNQITGIQNGAFSGCTSLSNVTLGSSLTTIGSSVFTSCTSLQNITIPPSVTTLGQGAFDSCTSFTTMTLPSTLTSIGWYIFNNCTNLTNIIVKGRFDVLRYTFVNVNSLNMTVTFDYSGYVPNYICLGVTKLKTVIFSNLITGIELEAFSGCTGLNEIIFPTSITTIQNSAFFNCPNLNSVSFLGEIATIGSNNFASTTDTCYYNVDEVINANSVTVANKLTMFTNKSIIIKNATPTITNFVTPMQKYNDISFSIVDPSSNSSGSFSYTSSNTSVATVSGNTVTVGTSGSTTITATQQSNYRNGVDYVSGTITTTFVVDNPPPQLGPLVIPNLSLSDVSFYITAPTQPENSTGTWTYASSDLSKATVSGNLITLISVGIVKISATITSDSNYCATTVVALFSISAPDVVPSSFDFVSAVDVSNVIPATVKTDTPSIAISPTIFTPATLEIMNPSVGAPEEKVQNRNVLVDTLFERFSTVKTISIPPTAFYMPPAIDLSNITAVKVIKTNGTTLQTPLVIDASSLDLSTGLFCAVDEDGNSVLFNGTSSFLGYNVRVTKVAYNNYTVVQTKPASSTIVTKTFNIVDGSGVYTIDGVNNNDISLIRGNKYNLVVNATGHPFWIQSVSGQYSSTNVYSSGITNNGTQTSTITFTVPTNAPNTLYYASQNNSNMQGRILITDPSPTTYSAVNGNVIYYAGFKLVLGSIAGQLSPLILVTLSNFSLPVKTLDAAPFTITPPTTTSSGGFTYTSSDAAVATIVGNVVTVVGLGTATITAVQAMTSTHLSDTITAAFTVNKIPTVLSNFVVPTKIYGNAAFTITPPTTNSDGVFTYTSSNTAVATIDGSSIIIVGVGAATITAVQATAARYITATITGNFVVNKITPTITNFSVPVKTFGDASFSIIAPTTDSDGVFTYTSSNTAVATVSGTTITVIGAGSATITANQSTTTNYLAATTTTSFVVNKATTVLSNFTVPTKTFGNAAFAIVAPTTNGNGAFTYTSSDTTVATVSGTTITIVGGGTSTITVNQATTANYLAATTTAILTVAQATPTITNFVVPEKVFGNAPFNLVAPTTNSAGLYTYTSSNTAVATIVGNTVTIVGSGNSTITAVQASTANYVSGTIAGTIIVRLTPVITNFVVPVKTFGDASFSIIAPTTDSDGVFTYTSSNTAVATVSGTTITIVGGGSATITATQSLTANYISGTISAPLVVNQATTVLSNFSVPAKTFGNAAFAITPPTTNGTGALTYTSSNTAVATVAGSTITIVGGGTATITANQASNANYTSSLITATLTVSQATTVLSNFVAITKTFGNAAFAIVAPTTNGNGAFTYTSSNTAVATIAGSTITIVGAGSATITASQASTANYLAATITTSLTVNQATTVLSNFVAMTKTFENVPFALVTPTTNGNGEFTYTSSNPAVATIDGNMVTIVGAGSSTITASQASTTNYLAATINASLTVNKATSVLTNFAVATKTFGDASFSIIAPTTNGDGAFTYTSSNTAVATIAGTTITVVGAGSATITASQATTTNYLAATTTASFTVNKATTVLTNFSVPLKVIRNAPFTVTAPTTNSNGAFTYTSSNAAVATIVGTTITIVGIGISTITASQATTTNFLAATVTSVFQVNNVTPTLSFSIPTKTIIDASYAITPPTSNSSGAFTYTSSNPSVATIVNGIVTIVALGITTITAVQAETADYITGTITATLTIIKATPTLVFSTPAKTIGSPTFLITPTTDSDGLITYASANPEVATIVGNRVAIRGVGSSIISATQAGTAIYTPITVTDTFQVNLITAELTNFLLSAKTFGDIPYKIQASSNSSAGITYTSSDTSVATIVGDMVTIVGVGSSTITASQDSWLNFTSATISETLQVNQLTTLLSRFAVPLKIFGNATFALIPPLSNRAGAFTYTSSNPEIATIDGNLVTILGAGTSSITASQASTPNSTSESITATFQVNPAIPALTNFAVPTKTFGSAAFSLVSPSSTSDGAFTYTSSNPAVATIAGDVVTIVGAGNATITAVQASTTNYISGIITAQFVVTKGSSTLTNFSVPEKLFGSADFVLVPPTSITNAIFTYTSSDLSVATIVRNVVTIVGIGSSTITATQASSANYTSGMISATFAVSKATPVLTSFDVSTKAVGDASFSLVAPTSNSDGAFTYTSSDLSVATIEDNVVTIVGAGSSTITANQASTTNFLSGSTIVLLTVNRIPTVLTSFSLPEKTFGDASFSLVAPTSNREGAFVYTSSDPTVATIDGDIVTIVGGGSATITAVQSSTASYRSGTISALLQVNKVKTVLPDFSVPVKIIGEPAFTIDPPATNSDGAFTYTSSNPAVATIDGDVVTMVGLGVTTIIARQAGTSNYTPAAIDTTFQVKRIRTVLSNFVIPAKTIGDTSFTLVPPTTNSDGPFIYTSSNKIIATVSGDVVTLVGTGNVTINVTQESTFNSTTGLINASLVVNKSTNAISWFSVPEKTFGNAPFTITPPTTTSNGAFTYTSSDTSVATILRNVVTIVGIGSSTITAVQSATSNYASGTISATFTVIEGSPSLANFSVPAKTIGDATFTIVPPTSKSNGDFTYTSSDTAVATVAGDVVTIVGVGSSTITANQASTEVFVSGLITSTLQVNKITTTLTGFDVPAKTFGDATFALVAPTTNSNGLITYTSSNPAVATIAGSTITIVGGGNTTITASQASATNYLAATIGALFQVNKTTTVLSNFSVPAKIIGNAAFALVPPTTNSNGLITYTSSSPEVATIEGGIVTIVGLGTTAITAVQASTANYTSESIRALFQVNMKTTVLTNFVVPAKKMGESAFTITPPTTNANGLITYTSSNPLVSTVSGDVVTIVGVGTSTIMASQASTTNSTSAFITAALVVSKTVTAISDFSVPVKVIGNAPFAVTPPTTNSNGAFTYTSSNPEVATISKNVVTIVGVGTSTITASQVSTANYTSETITALLQVNLGTPVLTNFASVTKAFGSASFSLVPPTTTSDGAITYTSSNTAVATIAGSTVTIVGAGTSTISANQASTAKYVSGTITAPLTVNPIAPVLTNFSVVSKAFGDASFVLVPPSSTSNGAFTYTSSNTEVATIAGNVVTIVGGGSSTITATQTSTTNYTTASVTAIFQVTSSTTLLTDFSAVSKTFGNAPFALVPPTSNRDGAFTYTSSDIKVATIAGNMVTIVGAGTSTITAVQSSSSNYSAATTTTTLTVNKGTPVITFTMPLKEMGNPNFTITDPSSNSTGAFTYTSSNVAVATIAKNLVTIKGIGTSTITATQAMSANFNAGTATTSFVINMLLPTIIGFNIPATKTVGDATFKITAPKSNSTGAFTYTSSNTAVATIAKGVVTIVGAGTTIISAGQPSTKSYGPGTVTATLTVNKKTTVLTNFSIPKKILGTAAFAITPPTTNGNGLFTYTSSNTSVATIVGNMVTIVGAGSSTITASQASTTNFTSGTISATLVASLPIPEVGALAITNKSLTNPTFTIVDPTKPNNNTGTWTYTSSDTTKATINGNSVMLFQAGIVTITASLSGDSTYSSRMLMTQFSISDENVGPSSFVFIKSSEVETAIPTTVLPGLSVVIPTTVSTPANKANFNPTAGTVAEKEANQTMIVNTLCNMFLIATTISISTDLLYVPKSFNKTKLKTIKIVRPTGTTSENPLVINTVASDSAVGFLCSIVDYGTSVRLNGVGSFAGSFMKITKGLDNKYAVIKTTKTNVTTSAIGVGGEVQAFVGITALIGY